MYFFKKKGKQYLDLTGNLILSHNNILIKARVTSAAPNGVLYPKYIMLGSHRIKATIAVLRFIWGKPNPLLPSDTDLKKPIVKVHKTTSIGVSSNIEILNQPGQDNLYNKFDSDDKDPQR